MKKEKIYENAEYTIISDSGVAPVFKLSHDKFAKIGVIKNGEKVSGIAYKVTFRNKEFNFLETDGKYIPYQYLTLSEKESQAEGDKDKNENIINNYKEKIKNATSKINWFVAIPVVSVGGGIVYFIAGKVFPKLPKWATISIGIAGGVGIAFALKKVMPKLYQKKQDKNSEEQNKDLGDMTKELKV